MVLLTTHNESNFLSAFQIGGGHNSHVVVLQVTEKVIKESRATRVQPFNEYRKRFNLKPYTSFYEFTGKQKYCSKYNLLLKLFEPPLCPLYFNCCNLFYVYGVIQHIYFCLHLLYFFPNIKCIQEKEYYHSVFLYPVATLANSVSKIG